MELANVFEGRNDAMLNHRYEEQLTWSIFRTLYDLQFEDNFPQIYTQILDRLPFGYIRWTNIHNLQHTLLLDELWEIFLENLSSSNAEFTNQFFTNIVPVFMLKISTCLPAA